MLANGCGGVNVTRARHLGRFPAQSRRMDQVAGAQPGNPKSRPAGRPESTDSPAAAPGTAPGAAPAAVSEAQIRMVLDISRMLAVPTDLDVLLVRIAEACTELLTC